MLQSDHHSTAVVSGVAQVHDSPGVEVLGEEPVGVGVVALSDHSDPLARFVLNEQGSPVTSVSAQPTYLDGTVDLAEKQVSITVRARDLHGKDLSAYGFATEAGLTENVLGDTLGMTSDEVELPEQELRLGVRNGC